MKSWKDETLQKKVGLSGDDSDGILRQYLLVFSLRVRFGREQSRTSPGRGEGGGDERT